MDDGVQLAITVYLPTGGPDVSRFPLLLWYLPGHRESIDPATGDITPAYSAHDLDFFTSHGYALAAAEMRGSGASFGVRELDRGPQIGRDGRQLVDWIAAQPWSDGTVGMVGLSYQGFSQYATAAEQPAALKAIFPEIAGFDDYTSMFYPGGILTVALTEMAAGSIVRDDLNHYDPSARRPGFPSVPVVDEDGDGELADEIPIDKDGDGDFLNDGAPEYADGAAREHVYYRATRDHLRNTNLTLETLVAAPFRDSMLAGTDYDYARLDPGDKPTRIAEAGIATYHRGGWFDYHARDTVMWQATLQGHSPTRLMMAPTGHVVLVFEDLASEAHHEREVEIHGRPAVHDLGVVRLEETRALPALAPLGLDLCRVVSILGHRPARSVKRRAADAIAPPLAVRTSVWRTKSIRRRTPDQPGFPRRLPRTRSWRAP